MPGFVLLSVLGLLLKSILKVTYCFPGVLSSGVHMFVFLILSHFYTPRVACEPVVCETNLILLCVSFLDFLLSTTFLPGDCTFFSLPFLMNVLFRFFDVELLFSSCLFLLRNSVSAQKKKCYLVRFLRIISPVTDD